MLVRETQPLIQPRVALLGHRRDHTSFYLDDFPDWLDFCTSNASEGGIEATHIRRAFFKAVDATMWSYLEEVTTPAVVRFLRQFRGSSAYTTLMTDIQANADYKRDWGPGPHTTADAVVLRSGRILLIRRGSAPMQGVWALPGGFLDIKRGETLYQCATRELAEETLIDLVGIGESRTVLKNAYRGRNTFDDPHRSERARIITEAHLFDLGSGYLPPIQGADDAAHAEWVPLTEVRADQMFDDHAFIIQDLLAKFQGRP